MGLKISYCNHNCLGGNKECSSQSWQCHTQRKVEVTKPECTRTAWVLSAHVYGKGENPEGTSKSTAQINSGPNVSSYFRFYSALA